MSCAVSAEFGAYVIENQSYIHIVLIPNSENMADLMTSDQFPYVMFYIKVVAKVLTNRLKRVLYLGLFWTHRLLLFWDGYN